MKTIRRVLLAAIAGCGLALAGGGASAVELCADIVTIGDWAEADGGCDIGDKNWTLNSTSTSLLPGTQIIFGLDITSGTYSMQIVGFNIPGGGAWNVNYTISVLDPLLFFISDMFAGADSPGGGSLLTKDVTGDPSGAFLLTVADGVENAGSEKHGLTAPSLNVDENFSVAAGKSLLSVSDTFFQGQTIRVPEPGTLLLLASGLLGLGLFGRRRGNRA